MIDDGAEIDDLDVNGWTPLLRCGLFDVYLGQLLYLFHVYVGQLLY